MARIWTINWLWVIIFLDDFTVKRFAKMFYFIMNDLFTARSIFDNDESWFFYRICFTSADKSKHPLEKTTSCHRDCTHFLLSLKAIPCAALCRMNKKNYNII